MLGEIETEEKVLVLRRIHVRYTLQADASQRETIERVHEFHAKFCPIYRSICGSIDITTAFEIVPIED